MAWEWSHTQDAYDGAQDQVEHLPKFTLLVVLREWAHYDRDKNNTLRTRTGAKRPAGFRLPNNVRKLPQDVLAARVWTRAEDFSTCDNGGYDAHVCPYGCHTVPFEYVPDNSRE